MARGGVTARISVGPPNCVWDGWVLQTGLNHRKTGVWKRQVMSGILSWMTTMSLKSLRRLNLLFLLQSDSEYV